MGHSKESTLCLGCLSNVFEFFCFLFCFFFVLGNVKCLSADDTWYDVTEIMLLMGCFLVRLLNHPNWSLSHFSNG